MARQLRCFAVVLCVVVFFSIPSFAQPAPRREAKSAPQTQPQLPNPPPNTTSPDPVANEIALLRKSLQALNTVLREIGDKVLAAEANQSGAGNDKQNRISVNLALLTQAEQRAEVLRKQLIELIEKETLYKGRLVQIEEDMRPENIERALNPYGTTRTPELRDARRRVLESERKGFENLLTITTQSRFRLEDEVRQADVMVSKLRQRVLPLIDKEIEKINPR